MSQELGRGHAAQEVTGQLLHHTFLVQVEGAAVRCSGQGDGHAGRVKLSLEDCKQTLGRIVDGKGSSVTHKDDRNIFTNYSNISSGDLAGFSNQGGQKVSLGFLGCRFYTKEKLTRQSKGDAVLVRGGGGVSGFDGLSLSQELGRGHAAQEVTGQLLHHTFLVQVEGAAVRCSGQGDGHAGRVKLSLEDCKQTLGRIVDGKGSSVTHKDDRNIFTNYSNISSGDLAGFFS